MTDDELAGKLEWNAKHGSHAFPPLLYAAAERIRALSAHVALLKASLAQAEREAEKPAASAEPVAWAHFAKNGNIRIWTSAANEAVRIAKENGIDLMPLYPAPQPDRVAELTAEVERLRNLLGDAADEIQNWGAYASEYFQEKHDLAGCVAEFKAAALAGMEAQS